jgi:GNAT superfamily N-acetyltransferase
MLSIRQAVPGDAALVLRFVKELADYERAPHEVVATEAHIDAMLFGAGPRAYCDIAEWQGEPAGIALWFYNFSTWRGRRGLYLEDLFVPPHLRGHGIGKALLVRLARRCVEEGLDRMDWQVLTWNTPAIAVYERIGAAPNDGWRNFRLSGDALKAFAGQEGQPS